MNGKSAYGFRRATLRRGRYRTPLLRRDLPWAARPAVVPDGARGHWTIGMVVRPYGVKRSRRASRYSMFRKWICMKSQA
jgi:hypothetical protein